MIIKRGWQSAGLKESTLCVIVALAMVKMKFVLKMTFIEEMVHAQTDMMTSDRSNIHLMAFSHHKDQNTEGSSLNIEVTIHYRKNIFDSIQLFLYSAKTIQLCQGAFQTPGPEPPLKCWCFAWVYLCVYSHTETHKACGCILKIAVTHTYTHTAHADTHNNTLTNTHT